MLTAYCIFHWLSTWIHSVTKKKIYQIVPLYSQCIPKMTCLQGGETMYLLHIVRKNEDQWFTHPPALSYLQPIGNLFLLWLNRLCMNEEDTSWSIFHAKNHRSREERQDNNLNHHTTIRLIWFRSMHPVPFISQYHAFHLFE
jgi:hypothetical protein